MYSPCIWVSGFITNGGNKMSKDIMNKMVMSVLINFMWFSLILLIDYVIAIDAFYGLLLKYEDIIKGIIFSLVLCSQGVICASSTNDNMRKNIIFTIISFAVVVYVYGCLIF